MKQLNIMLKPASSMCNLRCRYCFYVDESSHRNTPNYGIMAKETAQRVIESIYKDLNDGDRITFAFQGGEPTLAGLSFFEHFVGKVKEQPRKVDVSYALQTNGIAIDETWCDFFKKENFLVGLSLDGYAELHNACRVDSKGIGTYSHAINAKRLFDKYKLVYNILTVLTSEAAHNPQKVWQFIQSENIEYIQFIPCLKGLDEDEDDHAISPKEFYRFYKAILPEWKAAADSGQYVSVKFLEDMNDLLQYGQSTACGMNGRCSPQFVVESDGSVYPCDFYCTDEHLIGNLTQISIRQAFESQVSIEFRADAGKASPTCSSCGYRRICNGGCKRQRSAMCTDSNGFCGFRELLNSING
ncbi:MAG: SPASM domain-containing protein [Clostridiales bacterium]|nr:SPASM domain-containing protein [Clostridiales bacterium]